MSWTVVTTNAGRFQVARLSDRGVQTLMAGDRPWECATRQAAERKIEQLRAAEQPRLTPDRFAALEPLTPMTAHMRVALRRVVVDGASWRDAAREAGVTQSGILRALRKVAAMENP